MMKLLSWIPGGLVTKLAIVGLIYMLGIATGQLWENQRLQERERQESADRQRENHLQLVAWYRDQMKELRLAREQQEGAEASARVILERGKADADQAAQQARASLRLALSEAAKLRENVDGLKNVNGMLADAAREPRLVCLPDDSVRRAINSHIARINASPAIGNPQATATGGTASPDPADTAMR